MGIQTQGLLRDKNFGDIINPTIALNNLLTTLASGAVYLKEDLDFLENISQIEQSDTDTILGNQQFISLDSQLVKLLNIVKLNENSEIIRPVSTLKNRFDSLNLIIGEPRFQGGNGLTRRTYEWGSVYPSITSLPVEFDSSVFMDGPLPVDTDIFWGRGSISFKTTLMSQNINKIEGIQTFTGFLKPYQSGVHTFRITSGSNGGVIIELTNENGQSMLSSPIYYQPNFDERQGLTRTTLPLEKFKFYNIKIYFLRSPETVKRDLKHQSEISFEQPVIFNSNGVFYYDFLYDEDYLNNLKGRLGNFYDNKLPIMGTNFHSYKNNVEQFSIGGGEPASYKAMLTTGALTINYTPPKLYSTTVIAKTGNLAANRNYITGINDTSNIQVGNLVLDGSKTLSSFTYVQEIINESSVFLTKDSPASILAETLYFVKHKGLKGYTQDYNISTNTSLSVFKGVTKYKGDPYKPRDVVLHNSLTVGGFTSVSAISSDGSIIVTRPFLNTLTTNQPLVFYYRGGIDNISLDGYCTGGNVLQLVTAKTTATSNAGTNILTIDPNSIFDYESNRVSISYLATINAAISAYQVNYDAAIPNNTGITNASSLLNTITLSKNLTQAIKSGTALNISLSTPSRPPGNTPRYECFPPGETVTPFIGTTQGLATPAMSGVDIENRTATFNRFTFIDSDTVTNTNAIPNGTTSNINALLTVKDINDLTLFLIASTGNVNSTTTTTTTTTIPPWVQVTPTITGPVGSNRFGWSTAINGNAGTGDEYLIIGAPKDDETISSINYSDVGRVEVYKRVGSSWTTVDTVVDVNTNAQRGFSVKLNDTGLVSVVGAPGRYNLAGAASTIVGHGGVTVRSSTNNGTSYSTLTVINDTTAVAGGTTFDTSNKFGWSVCINGAGSRIAVGAPGVDITPNTNIGRVRAYATTNSGVSWSQLGNDIVGESANDECGYSVAMNTAGDILAATSLYKVDNNLYGRVRVFQHNGGSPGTWSRIANSIDGPFPGYLFGNSIALNSAGDIIVIGAPNAFANSPDPGIVRVYKYSSILNSWVQYGQDIIGTGASSNQFGDSVSINSTGDSIVVGAATTTEKGQVKIYIYNSLTQSWDQLSNSIEGDIVPTVGDGTGYSVSINNTGNRVLLGSPFTTDSGSPEQGVVRVYSIAI